jgi:replicative DNA helicase
MTDTAIRCEREVLGAILADNSQLRHVHLQQRDFSVVAHGQIFDLARRLIGAGKVLDAVTMAEALTRETGRNEWLELTVRLQQDCLAPANAPQYAEAVRKASLKRQAAVIGKRLVSGGDDVIADTIRELIELSSVSVEHSCHVSAAISLAADQLEAATAGKLPGVPTGIRDLDDSLGGMHDEDLIVIAARPAMGKTAFMLNLALAANVGVGVISGEQGRTQLGMRFFAMEGPVSLHRMRTGKLDDEEWSRVARVMSEMQRRPLWIFDRPSPTIDEIVAQARAWKFHNNIGLLMVDYLQIIRGGNGSDFRFQVGDITQQLKNLGRELKIPVVALSQVKREVESRPLDSDGLGRMPYMADLAEASFIEQIADQIITLYRPEVYDDQPQYRGLAYFNACKNKHGPIGCKPISWRGEFLKFGDLARQEMTREDRWSAA